MLDPRKQGETITIPTEEEQETVTGGRVAPGRHGGLGDATDWDMHKHRKLCRPKWDPGGPPQVF